MQDKGAGGCDFVAHPLDYNHALFPRCAHGAALVFARFKQVSGQQNNCLSPHVSI
jgi:hypothetical protein